MSNIILLKKGLDRYYIDMPHNVKQSSGFMRCRKNKGYRVKDVEKFIKTKKSQVFERAGSMFIPLEITHKRNKHYER